MKPDERRLLEALSAMPNGAESWPIIEALDPPMPYRRLRYILEKWGRKDHWFWGWTPTQGRFTTAGLAWLDSLSIPHVQTVGEDWRREPTVTTVPHQTYAMTAPMPGGHPACLKCGGVGKREADVLIITSHDPPRIATNDDGSPKTERRMLDCLCVTAGFVLTEISHRPF